jgi:hypothetical protein
MSVNEPCIPLCHTSKSASLTSESVYYRQKVIEYSNGQGQNCQTIQEENKLKIEFSVKRKGTTQHCAYGANSCRSDSRYCDSQEIESFYQSSSLKREKCTCLTKQQQQQQQNP